MSTDLVIGIDLGTTNSCVGVFRDGKVEIIPNEQGNLTTPSYVGFTDKWDAKRLIGAKFLDDKVQKDMKHWPFTVIADETKPKVQITKNDKQYTYSPEEISAMILVKLKQAAEVYLKMEIENCVITVPAYFNDSQRRATIDAGKIAGLNVMRIINEPTAAALAYGFENNTNVDKNILVFDLGGGTFDVSILKICGSTMRVLSTEGNPHLGGEDFDNLIMEYVITEFEKTYEVTIRDNFKALRRIRSACENAKIKLSSAKETTIQIDTLIAEENSITDLDMNIPLSREKFEELNDELFKSTLVVVDACIANAKLTKGQIDEIILVGGSSRIPKIINIIEKHFDGKELNKTVNPDLAVAHGAAISGALLLEKKSKEIQDVSFMDVTPTSLGIKISLGLMSNIVPKNSTLPYNVTKTYRTTTDYQNKIDITVLEGESKVSKNNNILGDFSIEGFPQKPAGEIEVKVTFDIDVNNILHISCEETSSSIKGELTIKQDKGGLTEFDIERIQKEYERSKNEERYRNAANVLKNKIYDYCNDMIYANPQGEIVTKCTDMMNWVDENPECDKEVYEDKYKEIDAFCEKK